MVVMKPQLLRRQVRLSHQALFKSRPAEGNTSIVFSKACSSGAFSVGRSMESHGPEVWDHYLPLVKNCWRSLPLGKWVPLGCGGCVYNTRVSHRQVHLMRSNSFPFDVVNPMQFESLGTVVTPVSGSAWMTHSAHHISRFQVLFHSVSPIGFCWWESMGRSDITVRSSQSLRCCGSDPSRKRTQALVHKPSSIHDSGLQTHLSR